MNWETYYGPGVARHLDYPHESILEAFERAVQRQHDKPCTEFLGRTRSYDDIAAQVERVASGLYGLGVRPGDRVAIMLPTCPQNLIATLATFRVGAQVVQHNPLYTADELRPTFDDHGAKLAIVWDSAIPTAIRLRETTPLQEIVAVDLTRELPPLKQRLLRLPVPSVRATRARLTTPVDDASVFSWEGLQSDFPLPADLRLPTCEDTAVILYTSGTTGVAKGVPLSHANLLANCRQGMEWASLGFGEHVFLAALPMFHALGLTVSVLVAVVNGCVVEMVPTPDPELMLQAVKKRTPTFITGVPPMFAALVDLAEAKGVSLRGVTYSLSGAMALQPQFVQRWESATGGRLIEGYGLTECSPIVIGNPISDARRPGAIGVPFPDTDVRVVSLEDPSIDVEPGAVGELLVRGPQVFSGYLNRPQDTERAFVDGWFRTGDLVQIVDGFIVVTGRLKELIVTGGFNVSPVEVEDVLRDHPVIVDVAVVGVPSASGEEIVAVVVANGSLPPREELRAWAKGRLAAYKVPRRFEAVRELPTNAMGKVVRREVARLLDRAD